MYSVCNDNIKGKIQTLEFNKPDYVGIHIRFYKIHGKMDLAGQRKLNKNIRNIAQYKRN